MFCNSNLSVRAQIQLHAVRRLPFGREYGCSGDGLKEGYEGDVDSRHEQVLATVGRPIIQPPSITHTSANFVNHITQKVIDTQGVSGG